MTRNFSNQRRDGMYPSSHNSASGKQREEQSSRPARSRLSRDAVDRAWENGASRSHADYHPRQHPPTSSAQRQGRPAPAYERSRQPQNRRPYESFQNTNDASRQGGFQRSEDGPRRFNRPGYRPPEGQQGLSSERWTRPAAPQQHEGYPPRHEENRPPRFQQHAPTSDYRDSRRPPRFQQGGPSSDYRDSRRPPRFQQDGPASDYRDSRRPPRFQQDGPDAHPRGVNRPRPIERSDRAREQFAHGQRGGGPGIRRDSYNPRWQSRPGPQREYANRQREYPTPQNNYAQERPGRAQFEGDYERFTDHERADTPRPERQTWRPEPTHEPHVTRLPDGRVLKGSRPSQRKQAQFWNNVEEESGELLANVAQNQPASPPEQPETKAARAPKPDKGRVNKVKTVKTARAKDAKPHSAKVARKNAHGSQKQTIHPSQRGYKWPTAGE